jgi:hypothetical protein
MQHMGALAPEDGKQPKERRCLMERGKPPRHGAGNQPQPLRLHVIKELALSAARGDLGTRLPLLVHQRRHKLPDGEGHHGQMKNSDALKIAHFSCCISASGRVLSARQGCWRYRVSPCSIVG